MGDAVLHNIERTFAWIQNFDVLVWSYQLGIAKPDPEIYRHALERLGTAPGETLFIDDKRENIDAAVKLGMRGMVFTNPEDLRGQIREAGLEKDLPLP